MRFAQKILRGLEALEISFANEKVSISPVRLLVDGMVGNKSFQ